MNYKKGDDMAVFLVILSFKVACALMLGPEGKDKAYLIWGLADAIWALALAYDLREYLKDPVLIFSAAMFLLMNNGAALALSWALGQALP